MTDVPIDGDRIFFGNDPALAAIADAYDIDYRRSLGEIIAANTDVDAADLPATVFLLGGSATDAPTINPTDAPATDATAGPVDDDPTDDDHADDRDSEDRRRDRADRDRRDRPERRDRPARRA